MNSRIVCILIMVSLTIIGCRKEEPNPELIDPIYSDLSKDLAGAKAAKEEAEKAVEAAEKALMKAPTRTIERRNAEEDIQKTQDKLNKITQLVEYYEIRVERRKFEARRDYKIAFAAEKSWPDPREFEAYKTNKRLVQASKNWSDRVPKFSTTAPTQESAEKKGGGGTEGPGTEGAATNSSSSHSGSKEGVHHN